MMIKSMTGYGRVEKNLPEKRVIVEIKTLNSKQTDLMLKLPAAYNELEIEMRNLIANRIKRGKIFCQFMVEYSDGAMKVNINKPLVINYLRELEELQSLAQKNYNSDLLTIAMRLPDSVSNDVQKIDDSESAALMQMLNDALDLVDDFRINEGDVLAHDFDYRINLILTYLSSVAPFEANRIVRVRERIENELVNFGTKINVDKNRLEQELVFYLEKLDITEEKIRLAKHCEYFLATMNSEDDEKGKKLGFITQEIGREINTLGSKANDAEMQRFVVQMKDELEKIKEQLLNIL